MPDLNRFRMALDIQDAVNLRALANAFARVVAQAQDETRSTEATWADPAVVLFVSKFESLCRSEDRFSEAYKECQRRAG